MTDSGGYQIFSLNGKISEEGAHFRAPHNGEARFLTPEVSMQVQRDLGSDIVMVLDECINAKADFPTAEKINASFHALGGALSGGAWG